jgi:REP element-mobilizing transposase RayT
MTQARRQLAPPQSALTVHCVQRCVRRAFLCGVDQYSGQSFEHRKAWVEQRLRHVSDCFAVGVHAYAVMSNHLHVVLQFVPDIAERWTDNEVAARWVRLFPPREDTDDARLAKQRNLQANPERLARCRGRLADLSWFMRCLAEPLARRANAEDACKGRFWEGRFKCQRLLDDRALIAAMAYVDLNPVRAGMTDRLDASAHTSVFERLQHIGDGQSSLTEPTTAVNGLPLVACLPLGQYLQLVDWTGRQLASGKRGIVRGPAPGCLDALGADKKRWAGEVRGVGSRYWRAVGSAQALVDLAASLGQVWVKGIGFARFLSKA